MYSQPADGSRPAEPIVKLSFDQFPYSMLPDGTLLYLEIHPKTGRDLWTLAPGGKPSPLRVTGFNEGEARFTPAPGAGAGKAEGWLAYGSDESGQREVYVQRYPGGGNRVAVSSGGGSQPRWSPDGKELFYVTGDAVVAVAFGGDGTFSAPRRLFDRTKFHLNDYRFQSYQLAPDGKRFLMIRRDEGSVPRQLNVMMNWMGDGERGR
jgi:serine/threonine-protein kinase